MRVIEWDGSHLPDEMKDLPPGRYVLQPIAEETPRPPDEDEGLKQSLASLAAREE